MRTTFYKWKNPSIPFRMFGLTLSSIFLALGVLVIYALGTFAQIPYMFLITLLLFVGVLIINAKNINVIEEINNKLSNNLPSKINVSFEKIKEKIG